MIRNWFDSTTKEVFPYVTILGEEVKNPTRAIPIATILCIAICTVAYAGVSIACTITLPYDTLDPEVPIPQIFREWGLPYLEKVVSGGAICALTTRQVSLLLFAIFCANSYFDGVLLLSLYLALVEIRLPN